MNRKLLPIVFASLLVLGLTGQGRAAQDPNFHIYLAFGQSNMEGNATPEAQDKVAQDRFKLMPSTTCGTLSRTQGTWAPAIAPLARCNTGLGPADWFGRTLVDSLPSGIKIGVVVVAVGGTKIEGFDLDTYQAYYASSADWLKAYANEYGGNPYARLLSTAKEAQKSGVIKGVLLHQGESNSGDATWPSKVKKIYDRLLSDLGVQAKDVPLLAGELVGSDQSGSCAGHNAIIAKLPQTIPTSYVISSKGCPQKGDGLHFTAPAYREMGKRYAQTMLGILRKTSPTGIGAPSREAPSEGDFAVYDLKGARVAWFRTQAGMTMEAGWGEARRNLPGGIYWIRGKDQASAIKVLNGR